MERRRERVIDHRYEGKCRTILHSPPACHHARSSSSFVSMSAGEMHEAGATSERGQTLRGDRYANEALSDPRAWRWRRPLRLHHAPWQRPQRGGIYLEIVSTLFHLMILFYRRENEVILQALASRRSFSLPHLFFFSLFLLSCYSRSVFLNIFLFARDPIEILTNSFLIIKYIACLTSLKLIVMYQVCTSS